MKGFVQKPIEQIEQKIETAKNKRKASKANAAKAGQELFTSTASDLAQLKSIVVANDLKYSSVADKVANEILQCSIDYFNDSQEKDSSSDYAETAMKLAKQAETLAVGSLTKDRVKDSINTLEGMKDRELNQAISVLQSIKDGYDKAYREIARQRGSFGVDTQTSMLLLKQGEVVKLIKQAIPQENIEKIKNSTNKQQLNKYITLVNTVMNLIWIDSYKKEVRYLAYYNKPSSGGCYIATMAYGSYEHPQVMKLRKFRNEFLAKSIIGRELIRIYYFISPKLVELLKNQKDANAIIRKSLNQFIRLIDNDKK